MVCRFAFFSFNNFVILILSFQASTQHDGEVGHNRTEVSTSQRTKLLRIVFEVVNAKFEKFMIELLKVVSACSSDVLVFLRFRKKKADCWV